MEKEQDVIEHLNTQKKKEPKRKIHNTAQYQVPKRLWQSLCLHCDINEELRWADLNKKQMNKLCTELCAGIYKVKGKSTFKEEFVTAGGVQLKEVDFKTYESKILNRLYFTGEALDIDAVTGGFNFQAAWTSGFLAGQSIVKELSK